MIPHSLAEEYRFVERLGDPESRNTVLRVEDARTGYDHVLKLPARSCLADDVFLQALSRRAAAGDNRLVVPSRVGWTGDGRFFTVADHFPCGSLHACLAGTGRLPAAAVRPLVRDLAGALAQLHRVVGGRRIVHCDVKPSNVLVARDGSREADWAFRLADFDSAVLLPLDGSATAARTVGYAAPEALIPGEPGPAMDYWSLGMLLLTCLRGRHPFADLSDGRIGEMLVTDWRVDAQYLADIRDEDARALVGGLMQPSPVDRWGGDEIRRWLDGDAETVMQGLRGLGETAAQEPFAIGGEHCYTVGNAARALLRGWDTETLYGDEFPAWLHQVSRTAWSCAEQARRLPRDVGLLHFCATLYPGGRERMPALWRGERVSVGNLAALAGRAVRGDSGARSWLLDLLREDGAFRGRDGGLHYFCHERGSGPERSGPVAALVQSVDGARQAYLQAWEAIGSAGAPGSAPGQDEAWLHAVLIACAPVDRGSAPDELFDPLLLMLRADWFFVFGTDPDRINPSQRFVLRELQQASLLSDVNIGQIDESGAVDPDVLRGGVALSDLQARLLRSLAVPTDARIASLCPGDTYAPESPPAWLSGLAEVERSPGVYRRRGERPGRPPGNEAHRSGGEPALTVRIVRLDVAARPPAPPAWIALDREVHLALIAWSGGAEDVRLTVTGAGTGFPAGLTRASGEGRLLLVVDRSVRIEIRCRGRGRTARRNASVRIRVGRREPRAIHRVAGAVRAVRHGALRAGSGPIRKAGVSIMSAPATGLLRSAPLAGAAVNLQPVAALRRSGPLTAARARVAGATPVAGVGVSARQRRHAALYRAWQDSASQQEHPR